MTILRGVRPVALQAVSERERLMACPHRAQAAVNHIRALQIAETAPVPEPAPAPAKKKGTRRG